MNRDTVPTLLRLNNAARKAIVARDFAAATTHLEAAAALIRSEVTR